MPGLLRGIDHRGHRCARDTGPPRSLEAAVDQYHRRQTCPAPHTAHLRTWRLVVRATQTPPTRVLPGPHAKATCAVMPSGWGISAGDIACADVAMVEAADVAMVEAKAATAINLIIRFSRVSAETLSKYPGPDGWL